MTNVVPLAGGELPEFFDFLYEGLTGYVCAPTLDRTTGEWEDRFFAWPEQRAELVTHVTRYAPSHDVYYTPAVLSEPSRTKGAFRASRVAWTEFDGVLPDPDAMDGVPEPAWVIQSSDPENQHWLWKLEEPVTSADVIEQVNRKVQRKLGADASAWDATQVLRPPGTINHKSGGNKPTLTLLRSGPTTTLNDFGTLPSVVDTVPETVVIERPSWDDLLFGKVWPKPIIELIRKNPDVGRRSSAMMRLAYDCSEQMNLNDGELYTVLYMVDERWGKFKNRADRERRLLDIINKVRETHPFRGAVASDTPILGVKSLLAREEKVEWLVEGLLPAKELVMMKGLPESGKTQLSLQFGMHLGLGKDFLDFKVERPIKTLFLSFEMNLPALKEFMSTMAEGFNDNELDILEENFRAYPRGYGITLDNQAGQDEFTALVRREQPEGIFIDSLSTLTDGSLSDETASKTILNYLSRLMAETGCFVWLIHHNRKPNSDNKNPDEQADAYGSVFISARTAMQINVRRVGDQLELKSNKSRLAVNFPPFKVERYDGLQFRRVGKDTKVPTTLLTPVAEEPIVPVDRNEKGEFDF